MTQQENRQAVRIARVGKEAERLLFELVSSMQSVHTETEATHDWKETAHQLELVANRVNLMRDLITVIRVEVQS
jgi:hypothetical protein